MALVSPGVEVSVIDESNYVSAATNSVPYFLIATAQNKISGSGSGVAAGTLATNAGKVYLITSQRDLTATFGVPFFYKTANGTPINGYELNEYGLLSAYSALGVTNRAYVQRADVDLAALTATLVRPTGAPAPGTVWLDTAQTSWGIFQWNQSTGEFSLQTPIVITDPTNLSGQAPAPEIGSIGDYAVVSLFVNSGGTMNHNSIYYKNLSNVWVKTGTDAWKMSWPALQGANSVTGNALTVGNNIRINGTQIVLTGQTLASLVTQINAAAIPGVTAESNLARTGNRLWLYAECDATSDASTSSGGVINIDPASTAGLLNTLGISLTPNNLFQAPALVETPNYEVPRWRTTDLDGGHPTGSIWVMTTNVNSGMNLVVKKYDSTVGAFVSQSCQVFTGGVPALNALDPAGGGKNIPAGTIIALTNPDPETCVAGGFNETGGVELRERYASGPMVVSGATQNPVFAAGTKTITIQYSQAGTAGLGTVYTANFTGTTPASMITAISAALPSGSPVSASVNDSGAITFTHSQGGIIVVCDVTGTALVTAGFNTSVTGVVAGVGTLAGSLILTYWLALDYVSSNTAPDQDPNSGTYWYYSATDQVDIMVLDGGAWRGYRTVTNDVRGYNLTQTDPAGPIVSSSAPTEQSDGTDLVLGDLWIDTGDLEVYPVIKRWQSVDGVRQWVVINNTDQTTTNGVLFADARWAANGTTDPVSDSLPAITSLLVSNYTDVDAPDARLYPEGMLLFNTRRSGFNVKTFQSNYFNAQDFAFSTWSSTTNYSVGARVLYNAVLYVCIQASAGFVPTNVAYWSPLETNTWVTASGNRADGSPYMGRQAVRQIVVAALRSAIDTQDTLREEQVQFNLLACPQYPELMRNMVALNNERNNTGFIVGDTPLRLPATGTDIAAWATNAALSTDGEAGMTISDPYLGVFYPACTTTDLSGATVVQPASHMMIRTIIRNDEVAFPWLAPAGVRRGVVDNADAIGYVDAQTGEFVTIATGQGLRDVLYTNKINPITFIPGVGITNYGNKTESPITSALDRINVARLVAFVRGRLQEIAKNFVFEPNDQITRNEIANAIDGLMIDLVAKRGVYDYLVVCDETNNTPARIDRNELYVDIAIEPVKAVEFIYIPLRIKNTGEIAAGQSV